MHKNEGIKDSLQTTSTRIAEGVDYHESNDNPKISPQPVDKKIARGQKRKSSEKPQDDYKKHVQEIDPEDFDEDPTGSEGTYDASQPYPSAGQTLPKLDYLQVFKKQKNSEYAVRSKKIQHFYIEYTTTQGETKKINDTDSVLNFIIDYFTKSPDESELKEIKAITGNFDIITKEYILTKNDTLNERFVRFKNRTYPKFYCYNSTENSSLMATFYLAMMVCIESEMNKELPFKKVLNDLNLGNSASLNLSKPTALDHLPKVCFAYMGILKKTLDKIHKKYIQPKSNSNSIVNWFKVEESSLESVKKELLIGAYCCLEAKNLALERLKNCLLFMKVEGEGVGLLNLFQIQIDKSKSEKKEEIDLTSLLNDYRFKKIRNLPTPQIVITQEEPGEEHARQEARSKAVESLASAFASPNIADTQSDSQIQQPAFQLSQKPIHSKNDQAGFDPDSAEIGSQARDEIISRTRHEDYQEASIAYPHEDQRDDSLSRMKVSRQVEIRRDSHGESGALKISYNSAFNRLGSGGE